MSACVLLRKVAMRWVAQAIKLNKLEIFDYLSFIRRKESHWGFRSQLIKIELSLLVEIKVLSWVN